MVIRRLTREARSNQRLQRTSAVQASFAPWLALIRGVARRHKEVRIVQLRQFERSRFFTGQLLTADDLQREQDYHRGKTKGSDPLVSLCNTLTD
jgi:hypothetical protein